jgi:predicted nucleotide-binding protein (sugar kinase/HSP70/actin superfamily)
VRRRTLGEDEIQRELRAYEARLRLVLGLQKHPVRHFKRTAEIPFTAAQRNGTTILFNGLTDTHDCVLKAAIESLGYRVQPLPVPDHDALVWGKEYCNRGQCNPTYYMVGNLLKHLQALRAAGESNIEQRYVFFTPGACGPCRFGMYDTEYRKALRDAGFGNFRIVLFEQTAGLAQSGALGDPDAEAGIRVDRRFVLRCMPAIIASDIVNALAYKIRPYELEPGATDRVLADAREILAHAFRQRLSTWRALRRIRKRFNAINVDFTRPKPKVTITGEFWAQTTEGDGSYRIQSWLQGEGAEVLVEPVASWIDYLLGCAILNAQDRRGIQPGSRKRLLGLRFAALLYKCACDFYRSGVGLSTELLVSQRRLARYARPYYDVRVVGGEGHLEVAKHVRAMLEKRAHMVVSVKPFGCMPSTQSDGIQSRVVADITDSIFIPVETSGDSEVSVKSRVQMALYEAKAKACDEVQRALDEFGISLQRVREYVRHHRPLQRPLQGLPRHYTGTAANFITKVGQYV